MTQQTIEQNLAVIGQHAPTFTPKLGIILGSGVGGFVNEIQQAVRIPYAELPSMRPCHITGHAGVLHLGELQGLPIACFQGRNHLYEGHPPEVVQAPIRILKLMGVDTVILVSATGSLSADIPPGSLALISDHINLQAFNPLIGINDEFWGPRFPDMVNAYDPELRDRMQKIAAELNISLQEAVYIAVLGPSFETPAEIRAFRRLGADLVGMSTVSEVILARHCGIKVLAIAVATNMAAGLTHHAIDHQASLTVAATAVEDLSRLLSAFINEYATSI